jgi:phospho-N-acetylmuramoyl-pentapeptide-transferase
MMTSLAFSAAKILGISAIASIVAFLWAPFLINFLYKNKFWKKHARTKAITGEDATVFNQLHQERETKVPRMGGMLIWTTTVLIIFLFYILSLVFPESIFSDLNFFSRSQTWLPLFTLIVASLLGLLDDVLVVSSLGGYIGGGLSFKKRLLIVALMGLLGGIWFYHNLGWDSISIPLLGQFSIGIWYIPLFVIVMIACWSGGIIDGLDGLSGGTFASIFGAFTIISVAQGKVDLATFCAVITGTLFAFLWFNIPPARFYMSEVGSLGLTTTLSVVAFLTDSVMVLPIIAGLLVVEVASVIVQILSKKIRHKKIFLSTPIHHHFEALGWPAYKVTMRFWVIGIILAIMGVVVKLLG